MANEMEFGLTLCNSELSRWDFTTRRTHEETLAELDRLAGILTAGSEALCSLYLRICDIMRQKELTDHEIREVLSRHFPPPRVSEFIRIANAPREVYRRYYAGLIGFRAALAECRGYRVNSTEELKRRKIRRAAERLILLIDKGEIDVRGRHITIC